MNLMPDDYVALAGIGAIASAVISVIATIAAFLAAAGALRAAKLMKQQQRDELFAKYTGMPIEPQSTRSGWNKIADVVETAYTNMYVAAGQVVAASAMTKISAALGEVASELAR